MKALTILTLIISFAALFVTASTPQEKLDNMKHQKIMVMMQDSATMNMMMEHIAKDSQLRMRMMSKMMEACKGDEDKMMGMCKIMMKNKDAHSMMMNMMGEGKMTSEMKQPESGEAGHETPHATKPDAAGDEVLIKFKPKVEESRVTAMSKEMGMQEIKKIEALNIRVFKVTSGKTAQEIIEHCGKEPFVEYAEVNRTYKTQK